jgi:hypothetical protein
MIPEILIGTAAAASGLAIYYWRPRVSAPIRFKGEVATVSARPINGSSLVWAETQGLSCLEKMGYSVQDKASHIGFGQGNNTEKEIAIIYRRNKMNLAGRDKINPEEFREACASCDVFSDIMYEYKQLDGDITIRTSRYRWTVP